VITHSLIQPTISLLAVCRFTVSLHVVNSVSSRRGADFNSKFSPAATSQFASPLSTIVASPSPDKHSGGDGDFIDAAQVKVVYSFCYVQKVLEKADAERTLLSLCYCCEFKFFSHIIRKLGTCLEKEVIESTMTGTRVRERPHTTWQDNIKTWTGLSLVEEVRATEDHS